MSNKTYRMNSQPKWKCVGTLGDINPVEHGGAFIFVDTTGVYEAEIEVVEPTEKKIWVYRYTLKQCTYKNGILSDNIYHPEVEVWFAHYIDSVSAFVGNYPLIDMLCSDDVLERATAYSAMVSYHGIANFDPSGLGVLTPSQAKNRYSKKQFQVQEK